MRTGFLKGTALMLAAAAAASLCSCSYREIQVNEAPKQVSFSWWGTDDRNERTLQGLSEFTEDTGIDVKPQYSEFSGFRAHMDAQFYSDTEADVMQLNYDWLYDYSPQGDGFYNLEELGKYIDLSTYPKNSLECGRVNGKLIALPYSLNVLTFSYNKDLYDKYGVDIPTNWDELIAAGEILGQHGIYALGISEKHMWMLCCAYFKQVTGRQIFNSEGELLLRDADLQLMLEFANRLDNAHVANINSEYNRSDLISGNTAGVLTWISEMDNYETTARENGFEMILGDYLTVEQPLNFGWEVKPTGVYSIKKTTESAENSAKLLNFLINSSQMAGVLGLSKGVPISRSAVETLEARGMLKGLGYEAACKMNDEPSFENMTPYLEKNTYIEAFTDARKSIFYENTSPADAAKTALTNMIGS